MKSLRHLGLAVAILAVSGSALAGQGRHDHHQGRHDHHQGRGYHHAPQHHTYYHAPPATQCKVKTRVSHHGRHYREEVRCKTPKHVQYAPRHVYVHPAPRHHVHVVHMPPPPPAVVIGPHGVKVHGTVSVGW